MNFKSLQLGTITINTFLPMRHKFAYSRSINICALGFDELLQSIFCLLLVVEAFSLEKVVEMLEAVIVSWWEVRWMWWMKQNFVAQFAQLSKCWLCNIESGIVVVLSVDQCQLQMSQFLVHLIDLLIILLGCNGFARIQKTIVDHTSSRPPNSDHNVFFLFGASLGLPWWLRG